MKQGFLVINKPCGPTSFDVVHRVRKVLGVKKVGHAGTLDPLASGVLVIALGDMTRCIEFLPTEPKKYLFGVEFGKTTATLDREGEVVKEGFPIPEESEIRKYLESFLGESDQIPPEYSSVKVQGVRAYKLARAGSELSLTPKKIFISKFELINHTNNAPFEFEVHGNSGLYVRALVRDLAHKLNTVAYATYIERTGAGIFSIENSLNFAQEELWAESILSPHDILGSLPSITVSSEQIKLIEHGNRFNFENSDFSKTSPDGYYFAFNNDVQLIAICKCLEDNLFQPCKVFHGFIA